MHVFVFLKHYPHVGMPPPRRRNVIDFFSDDDNLYDFFPPAKFPEALQLTNESIWFQYLCCVHWVVCEVWNLLDPFDDRYNGEQLAIRRCRVCFALHVC